MTARIAAISYQLGLNSDRAALDDLLDHAAFQFTSGALYADDAIPTGRCDRAIPISTPLCQACQKDGISGSR